MKCKCGNEIKVQMAGKVRSSGCKVLTAITTIITVQCNECGTYMQVPVQSDSPIT